MDKDLEQVKKSLNELDNKIDKMQSGSRPQPDQETSRQMRPHKQPENGNEDEDSESRTSRDEGSPEGKESSHDGDDPHPSDIGRFRQKLEHGHEAAQQEHYEEAQRIYRSLIREYRSLKSEGKITDKDKERLHDLYAEVDRAKE